MTGNNQSSCQRRVRRPRSKTSVYTVGGVLPSRESCGSGSSFDLYTRAFVITSTCYRTTSQFSQNNKRSTGVSDHVPFSRQLVHLGHFLGAAAVATTAVAQSLRTAYVALPAPPFLPRLSIPHDVRRERAAENSSSDLQNEFRESNPSGLGSSRSLTEQGKLREPEVTCGVRIEGESNVNTPVGFENRGVRDEIHSTQYGPEPEYQNNTFSDKTNCSLYQDSCLLI